MCNVIVRFGSQTLRASDIDGYGVASFYDLVGVLIQSEVDVNLCNHFDRRTVK